MTCAIRIAQAALVYAMAMGGAVLLGCAATGSCSREPGTNIVIGVALVALTLLATGLVTMGAVLVPAALLLRRIRWLYWWSVLPVAAATAAVPSAVFCATQGGQCDGSGFGTIAWMLVFAGLCGGLFLWWAWFQHEASQPQLSRRIAAQPPAVKAGLAFAGAYVAALAAAAVFVAVKGGGERGMIFLYIALPWSLAGGAAALAGLVLNGLVAFAIGYGAARAFARVRASSAS